MSRLRPEKRPCRNRGDREFREWVKQVWANERKRKEEAKDAGFGKGENS